MRLSVRTLELVQHLPNIDAGYVGSDKGNPVKHLLARGLVQICVKAVSVRMMPLRTALACKHINDRKPLGRQWVI